MLYTMCTQHMGSTNTDSHTQYTHQDTHQYTHQYTHSTHTNTHTPTHTENTPQHTLKTHPNTQLASLYLLGGLAGGVAHELWAAYKSWKYGMTMHE